MYVGTLNADLSELRPISRGMLMAPRIRSSQCCLSQSRDSRASDLRSDSATSVQSVADEDLTLTDIERMFVQKVEDKKEDLKAAFQAFDTEGNYTITKGEFRRVIEHFLITLTQAQFEVLLTKVPKRANGSVAYMEFLRKYCKISSAKQRIPNICENQQNQTLGELQCNLKDKIGSNLKNVTRAFRLFDFNLDGQIQQHEFRRVLEAYCFPLSDQDFQRLWSHYRTSNTETVFYKEFLERLGIDCENYHKKTPECVQQALNWDICDQMRRTNRSIKTAWADTDRNGDNFDEIQTKFLKKVMSMNYNLVQKALHAFDITGSGLISPEDLKSVLSSFIFPMNERIFSGLLNRLGVEATEPISWSQFLALFQDRQQPLSERKWSAPIMPGVEGILPKLQHQVQQVHTLLKRGFQIFDENKTGVLPCGELRRVVEGLTFRLTDEQFKGLVDLLDPECSGVINYGQFIELCQNHTKSRPMTAVQRQAVFGLQEMHKQRNYLRGRSLTDQSPVSSVSIHTWNTVETILRDRLSEQLDAVLNLLDQLDHTQNGTVNSVELKRVVQQYGLPVSDSHFEKLCVNFKDSGGINYKRFLKGLGIQNISAEDRSTHGSLSLFQRTGSAYHAHLKKLKGQALQDVVLKKLKNGLDGRGVSLQDCLKMSGGGPKATLTLADFSKILDDCRIMLDKPQFQTLTQALGFHNGQISHFDLVGKFEKSTAKERNHKIERENLEGMPTSLISAEECLQQLKKKIKDFHGDALSAFRVMDKNRDGVVSWRDFRPLFDSLQFVIKEKEYQRLLDLMGFQNGATLNYAEFFDIVHRNSKEEAAILSIKKSGSGEPCDSVGHPSRPDQLLDLACEQVHAHLVADIRHRWHEISKDLCHFNEDGEAIIHKIGLRRHLFKYSLPITPRDFEKLWMRYDKGGKGYLTQTEFFETLHIVPEGQDHLLEPPITEGELDTQLEQHVDREASPPCRDVISQDLRHSVQSPQSVEDLSPDRAVQRIREVVTAAPDHLHKAFSAFDKTGRGVVSPLEFRRVLDHFCFRLSDRQFNHLLMKLKVRQEGNSMVNWRQFLETFQFNREETAEEWLEKLEKVHFPSQARPLSINEILERVKDVVSTRLYVITKEMVALDYAHINTISKQDFKQICDRHVMRLTSEQFENLWNILPVNAYGNLDFHEFLTKFSGKERDDHVPQEGQGSTSPAPLSPDSKASILKRPKTASCSIRSNKATEVPKQTKRPHSAGAKTASSLNGETVNRRVRCQIHSCWKIIQRRCREVDPDRRGEIETGTFLGIMEDLRIQMTPLEFEQLMAKYDLKSNGCIRYSDFLRHFVLPHRPLATSLLSRNKLQLPKMPLNSGPLTTQCAEAMLRIYGPVKQFWRSIRQSFVSFDKDRSRKISLQDFRKVLRHYSVNLTEEEFFHVTSFFDKDMSGKISYNEFLSTFLG
ncbi:EF-hand calcium-binding domain-containing protein 6 isoform X1 [Alosa sapidissima]|uniref:EF-hand calcium-binding domain-containing protein 6 isoform X1 n=1 Tax=Alosa sapidissima TaxID=34773 RepID=UPI001C08BB06|nr:EF-hand calcium-binding domain-containing protein 6 isoform X1 [Alosa sapidissima]XP_041966147.1 EF-hand calcium-binding domain-containing protein 6 isoform X1 [Alosa sapidissima]